MALIKRGSSNISTQGTNIGVKEEVDNLGQEVYQTSEEQKLYKEKQFLEDTKSKQGIQTGLLGADAESMADQEIYGETSLAGSQNMDAPQDNDNSKSASDLYSTWSYQTAQSFNRGVGQTIASNGDLINMVAAATPFFDLANGTLLGNFIKDYGDSVEDSHKTQLKEQMLQQEISWNSLASVDFWTTTVAEQIPLMIEMLATGYAAGGLAEGAAKGIINNKFVKKNVAGVFGKSTKTLANAARKSTQGVESFTDLAKTGKGLAGALVKDIEGVKHLTDLGKASANFVGAGLANNLMSGAINGMQTFNTMKEDNARAVANGQKPIYTDEEMANTASGTVGNNMAYLPIDILSWGVSYGRGLEKLGKGFSSTSLKTAEQIAKASSTGFKSATAGVLKSLAKVTGHAVAEGWEEQYQEVFENWATEQAKQKAIGGKSTDFWDYYNQEDQMATKVISAATGGLFGGVGNLKTFINGNAQNALNFQDANQMLRNSVDAKEGKQWQEKHIYDHMVNLHNSPLENKTDLFNAFTEQLVEDGVRTKEDIQELSDTFNEVGEAFEMADGLNILGKQALVNNLVTKRFLMKSMDNAKFDLNEKLDKIDKDFPEDSREKKDLIDKEIKAYDEDIKAKSILATMAEQNKLNLISGKEADPLNMQFVISRTGTERLVLPEFISDFVDSGAFGEAGIYAGLSRAQYEEYIAKSDDEIYEDAKKANIAAMAKIKNKGFLNSLREKFKRKKETKVDENGEPLPDVEVATQEYADEVTGEIIQKVKDETNGIELQEKDSVLSEEEVESLNKTQQELEAKETLTPEEETQLKETIEKIKENEVAVAHNEDIEKANNSKRSNDSKRDESSESEFEKNAIEKGLTPAQKKKQTIAEKNAEETIEAKKKFEGEVQEELDKEDGVKEKAPTNYKPSKGTDGNFTVIDEATNEPLKTSTGKVRVFQKEGPAKAAATVANKKANASTSGNASKPLTSANVKAKAKQVGGKVVSTTKSIIGKAAAEAAELAKGQQGMSAQGIWAQTKKVGKAIVGGIVGGVKGVVAETQEQINEQQKRNAVDRNVKQDALREAIIGIYNQYKADIPTKTVRTPNGKTVTRVTTQADIGPAQEGQVNPRVKNISFDPLYDEKTFAVGRSTSPSVAKSDLDAYLNSSIAKVTWEPATIHKQLALNNYLKKLGINMDIVYASNLFTAVGHEAVGYALASTIYIDEKVADQIPIFMHEMSHINYRTTKDSPATKQAVAFAQKNLKLVEQVKNTYAHLVKYKFIYKGESVDATIQEMLTTIVGAEQAEEIINNTIEDTKGSYILDLLTELAYVDENGDRHLPVESPMEVQDYINEELFAFTMEGELSKKYNDYFQPYKEKERKGHVRGWLKWLNDLHIKYADNKDATLKLLADGKKVPRTDLFDFITEGFAKELAKNPKMASTQGMASLVFKNDAETKAERQRISDEKVAQQEAYDPEEGMRREANNFYAKTLAKIKKNIDSGSFNGGESFTDQQIEMATEFAIQKLQDDMAEGGAYDDFDMMNRTEMKGATRILNNFAKSYNYVKRMRFQMNKKNKQGDFNEDELLDRNELISEISNLAFETKGNSNEFIRLIENSPLQEISVFNDYMDKTYGDQKYTYLNSMALILSNTQTIQAVKSVVNKDGSYSYENSLSMSERNKVNNRLNRLFSGQHNYYEQQWKKDTEPTPYSEAFQEYKDSYDRIKKGTPFASDYTNVLEMLSPYGTNVGKIINDGYINMRGASVNIKTFIDNLVKQGAMETPDGKRKGRFDALRMKPFIEAIADTNRKFTSYSVVQNAEGHMQPTKITNNNLLNVVNDMNSFMADKRNTFAGFKRRFANITSDKGKRTLENPMLRGIWDNYKNGFSRVSVSQYLGLKHIQSGKNNMYDKSTDFTQTIEDFMMFGNGKKNSYQHNLGAFADSPRKFMMSVKKLSFDEHFSKNDKGGTSLSLKGQRQLEQAYNVYADLNKNEDVEKKMNSLEEFKTEFYKNIKSEIQKFNDHGSDLAANKTLVKKGIIDAKTEQVTLAGKQRIAEFVFNNVVNGLAAAEIFNPGVATIDISKRNKGNGSPIFTIGNRKVRMEAIPINDQKFKDEKGNWVNDVKSRTDSGMYITESMAKKIVAAGKGVFDLNHGLKLLNFHTEKDNPMFQGRSAYFKGHTTIISEKTLETEPGLRSVYELLKAREAKFENEFFKKNGKFPSYDLMDGTENYIAYAVPTSAIKSNFMTDEQAKELQGLTYDALNDDAQNNGVDGFLAKEGSTHDKVNKALDKMYYGEDGKFVGLSAENFGPQQIMDKVTKQSTTPVQFIASVIVNGSGESLKLAEEIQSLIRMDMDANFAEVVKELKGMNPKAYKDFILKSLDLENMDQAQRLIIEENMTNLNHPAIADFVNNTLARKLKMSANRLKTNGTIAQQKPNHFYRIRNGYQVMQSNGKLSGEIRGYSDRTTKDGRTGSGTLEIVLPKHMNDGHIKARKYITADSPEALHSVEDLPMLANQLKSADENIRMAALKDVAMSIARDRFRKQKSDNPNALSIEDYIGRFYDANGNPLGYYVKGDMVIGSRIPSHGPASSGVFEVIDFSEQEGNQTIVSDEWTTTAGADYDGDALFIQAKGKKGKTPNFDKALDKTVELYTSPEMYEQIRAKIEFTDKINKIMAKQKTEVNKAFPMSPEFNREAYNNTMVSKRNIGIALNMNRIANYLATYKVEFVDPITVNGVKYDKFQDGVTGTESRNNQSAMLANIILDNAKWHYADALGLNEQTINQFSLLINMGMSLEDVSRFMNSRAIKTLNEFNRDNQSPYLIKRRGKKVNERVAKKLGLSSIKNKDTSYNVDIDKLLKNDPQQEMNAIALMSYLEKMNSDILKVSRIMSGHKGVENNPFVLEQQIDEFEEVINNKNKKGVLKFNEQFAKNPDIAAYHKNAKSILGIMKTANNVYRASTSKLITKLNEKLGWDDNMDETQLKRVSDVVKRFVNSRMIGLNNISAEKKAQMRSKLFKDLAAYELALTQTFNEDGKSNSLNESLLFTRAINIDEGHSYDKQGSLTYEDGYVSANPNFFNESLGADEKAIIQREFMELPQSIKDGMIVIDLMDNGLTGNLSLANLFDEDLNHVISNMATVDILYKNRPIKQSVMDQLERIIVTNEFNQNDGKISDVEIQGVVKPNEVLEKLSKEESAEGLYNSMLNGNATYFKVNGVPYTFDGVTEKELGKGQKSGFSDKKVSAEAIKDLVQSRIHPYEVLKGDMNLEAISIADNNVYKPLKTKKSTNTDGKADHIIRANEVHNKFKKKSSSGKASSPLNEAKQSYYNQIDETPLTRQAFDLLMGWIEGVSEFQKEEIYKNYLKEKTEANELFADKYSPKNIAKMTDAQIYKVWAKIERKDMYAFANISTALGLTMANRRSVEQVKLTGVQEDGKDISLLTSLFESNNIDANHPTTQALIREINTEYKKFSKERSKYVKDINAVTDALYQEKFKLSDNSIIRYAQRIYTSLFKDRGDVYKRLYGNIVEINILNLTGGKTAKEFKLKDRATIEALYKSKGISQAEYDFYNVFQDTTSELFKYDPSGKHRADYIPHTAMGTMEMYSSRGLLGLLVNSKSDEQLLGDVKIYEPGTTNLVSFSDIKNSYNSIALEDGEKNSIKRLREFNALERKAKKLLKERKNEDGSTLEFSNMQNATLLDMSPMSRFSNSRSVQSTIMPSMDLNKALIDYVHTALFTNGNKEFKGFKKMMPLIDGAVAYNDKMGYKNAFNYVKEVFKDGFIQHKDQKMLGKTGDKIINGMVVGNLIYALGYKGMLIGKGLYAVGNVVAGKYMNIKREGGKQWLTGELRYWGTDKGFGLDALKRRKRAQNILSNLGYLDLDMYDQVSIEKKSGLDGIFTSLALLPMTQTEGWIQKAHMLGMLTEEEMELFDENGNYKDGAVQIPNERVLKMEERVKMTHGKGFTPIDQSRAQQYSLGRMFLQFSRHIPAQLKERFGKESVDVNGEHYIGSLRQVGIMAHAVMTGEVKPNELKAYYASLKEHEKNAFDSAMRGAAMMALFGFVYAATDNSSDKLSANHISGGAISDANIQFDADRVQFKMVPPAVRSMLAATHNMVNGNGENEE